MLWLWLLFYDDNTYKEECNRKAIYSFSAFVCLNAESVAVVVVIVVAVVTVSVVVAAAVVGDQPAQN